MPAASFRRGRKTLGRGRRHGGRARTHSVKRGIKRGVMRRRKGAFKRSGKGSKRRKQAITWSDLGDRALLYTYVDEPTLVNTTGAIGSMAVWSNNTVACPNVAVSANANLLLDDGRQLFDMFRDAQVGSVGGGPNFRVMRKTCEVSCRIVNAETSAVELWEYRCVARRDQTVAPQSLLNTAADNEVVTNQTTTGTVVPTVGTIVGGLYPMTIGATPFMFHGFVSQYRVAKVRKWELKPGQKKKLVYRLKKPKLYSAQNIMQTLGTISAGAGSSVPFTVRRGQAISLFVAKGTFATLSTGGATFTRGISNINIGMEYHVKYHYTWGVVSQSASATIPSVPGFSSNVAQAPLPIVANQPISTIAPITTTNGLGTGGSTGIGGRIYAVAGVPINTGSAAVGDGIETDV